MTYLNGFMTDEFPYYDDRVQQFVSAKGYMLLNAIDAELKDPAWAGFEHGRRWTHWKGCRGPLCRKAVRDHQREWREQQGIQMGPKTPATLSNDELIERRELIQELSAVWV